MFGKKAESGQLFAPPTVPIMLVKGKNAGWFWVHKYDMENWCLEHDFMIQ